MSLYGEVPIPIPEVTMLRRRIRELEVENQQLRDRLTKREGRPAIFGRFIQNQMNLERFDHDVGV